MALLATGSVGIFHLCLLPQSYLGLQTCVVNNHGGGFYCVSTKRKCSAISSSALMIGSAWFGLHFVHGHILVKMLDSFIYLDEKNITRLHRFWPKLRNQYLFFEDFFKSNLLCNTKRFRISLCGMVTKMIETLFTVKIMTNYRLFITNTLIRVHQFHLNLHY